MDFFLQQVVNALSLGGTYALLALGLAIVFSILGLVNFAHGELTTITGYVMFFAAAGAAMPFVGVVPMAVLGAILAAVLMERVAFRPVRGASGTTLLLTSFAVSIILQVLFQNFISPRPRPIPFPSFLDGNVAIGGIDVGFIQATAIVVTAVLLPLLLLFLRRTTLGMSMRAAAQDFTITRLMGIRANAVIAAAFALSGLLAGVAGVLWVAQRGTVDPAMGFTPVLKGFMAGVIGGLGSLSGAVAAGFLLGFIEVMLQAFLPQAVLPFHEALVWVFLIAILLWRPHGLLARAPEVAQ